jgi:hypothetical protein
MNKDDDLEGAIKPLPEVCLDLLSSFQERGIKCWIDSGSLLGLVRSGQLNEWEKDIDLGIWSADLDIATEICRQFASNNGLRFRQLWVSGIPYVIIIEPYSQKKGKNSRAKKTLPISVHLYYKLQDTAWSPQPLSLLYAKSKYPRLLLKNRVRDSSFPFFRHFRAALHHLPTAGEAWNDEVNKQMDKEKNAINLKRRGTPKHLADKFWTGWLFDFFEWRIPAHYFENIAPLSVDAFPILVPSDTDSYLTLRYGD